MFYWDQDLTASDSFCGAGGLGWGVEQAGAIISLAVNHDERSIATYQRNFPQADVRCAWMEDINWKQAPDTLLGVGAPECTHHSTSVGEKLNDQRQLRLPGWTDHDTRPEVEKSRASMWQVFRAAEAKADKKMPYHSLIFENVPEVYKWGGYGEWEKKMTGLGYEHQILSLNAMHFDVPQCRNRWIAVFWRKGAKKPDLDFRPLAPCLDCGHDIQAIQCWKNPGKRLGKYDYRMKGQYTYNCPFCSFLVEPYFKPAASIVDFSDRGIPIKERRQHKLPPLDRNTMERIQEGIDRFFKYPQIPSLSARAIPVKGVAPFWITYYSNGKPYSVYEPFCTFSTVARCAMVFPSECGSLDIQECSLRMLNEKEILAASGLRDGRMISREEAKTTVGHGDTYEIIADTKEELIRQCGHMVPPPLAQWVTQQVIRAI